MEPDPSDLSREELKQRVAELEAEKGTLQHQRDKALADQDAATGAFTPGPLPVIAAVCRESGLVETINSLVDWDEQQCTLSPGERVMALVMNVLTEGEPLYQLPEFFEGTDTENLFHDGIEPDNLNDDALGRGLDQLAETGLRTVLGTVLWETANRETQSPTTRYRLRIGAI